MSAVSRAYTFTDGTDAFGSQVENEFNTIYNAWNNADAGTSAWTVVKTATLNVTGASTLTGAITATSLVAWAAYIPTLAGFGTATNISFFQRRVGDTLFIRGTFKTGTSAGTQASMTIPSALAIDTTKIPTGTANTAQAGVYFACATGSLTSSNIGAIFSDGSTTDKLFFAAHASAGSGLTADVGTQIVGNSTFVTLQAEIPIATWTF